MSKGGVYAFSGADDSGAVFLRSFMIHAIISS